MRTKLINTKNPTGAYRFIGQTGTLNINNGTFTFVSDNGMFFSGNISEKEFSGSNTIIIKTENNVFTFEVM